MDFFRVGSIDLHTRKLHKPEKARTSPIPTLRLYTAPPRNDSPHSIVIQSRDAYRFAFLAPNLAATTTFAVPLPVEQNANS